MSDMSFLRYTDSSTAQPVLYSTKEIDFNAPYNKKKVYKVIIDYKLSGGTGAYAYYSTNGGATWTQIVRYNINGVVTASMQLKSVYTRCELLFGQHVKCNTFMLKFDAGAAERSLSINELEIIYNIMEKDTDA